MLIEATHAHANTLIEATHAHANTLIEATHAHANTLIEGVRHASADVLIMYIIQYSYAISPLALAVFPPLILVSPLAGNRWHPVDAQLPLVSTY
jgi:hypothetical protein